MVEWDVIFRLIELSVVIGGGLLLYNSIPAGKFKELVGLLDVEAKKTETSVDDVLVDVLKLLVEIRETVAVVPPDDDKNEV